MANCCTWKQESGSNHNIGSQYMLDHNIGSQYMRTMWDPTMQHEHRNIGSLDHTLCIAQGSKISRDRYTALGEATVNGGNQESLRDYSRLFHLPNAIKHLSCYNRPQCSALKAPHETLFVLLLFANSTHMLFSSFLSYFFTCLFHVFSQSI